MINHILIPLDESPLAECVLPHVLTIARSTNAYITLLHVLELPRAVIDKQAVDPLEWHLRKQKAEEYLHDIATKLRHNNLKVEDVIMEGPPAECVIDFANNNDVDLIALSSHGSSGLSGWNVSSVVQKIILRSSKALLLIRAYMSSGTDLEEVRYNRLFVGLDFSTRAEYILPVAVNLAEFHKAELILGMVIRKPELLHRFPLSAEEESLITRVADLNYRAASHYFDQLQSRLSLQGVSLQTRLTISDNATAALHDMVNQENADLVMLVAHGHSGERRWPYGSVAASFIAYGTAPLMIMQDLSGDEIKRSPAEISAREVKGH
ncbi:MAG TPA: universal stress protein [Anaerolineales bacterium]